MILAAGESQITFLDALAKQRDIDWSRVVCFNMDDFWDPKIPETLTCGYQLRRQLYDKVHPRRFHVVQHNAPNAEREAERFEEVLRAGGSSRTFFARVSGLRVTLPSTSLAKPIFTIGSGSG